MFDEPKRRSQEGRTTPIASGAATKVTPCRAGHTIAARVVPALASRGGCVIIPAVKLRTIDRCACLERVCACSTRTPSGVTAPAA